MRRLCRVVVALLVTCTPAAATAGQLQAGPTLVEITPGSAATRLVLGNTSDRPIAAQVRVYAWSQVAGEDQLVPSEQLVVSPPIAELAPGAEQVVRVVRLGPAAAGLDQTYRVVVDELPGTGAGTASVVTLRLRYVLPVFVRAADSKPPSLSCTLETSGAQLTCENSGGQPAQLGATRLVDDAGRGQVLSEGLFGYVLPTSRRAWALQAAGPIASGSALRLETRVNGQLTSVTVQRQP